VPENGNNSAAAGSLLLWLRSSRMPSVDPLEFRFAFGGSPQDLTITLSGAVDALGLKRLNDALVAEPQFGPGLMILVDVTRLDTSRLDEDALFAGVGPVVERDAVSPPRAVAIVVADAETLAKAVHYRAHLGGSASRRRIFTDRDEAIAWLRKERGPIH
jgi:hypothetical protein